MATGDIQVWVGILGTFVTVGATVSSVLGFQRRRDRTAAVGSAFREIVDALASENATTQMAAAILIRRFFDAHAEQGSSGTPYASESVAVIAGLLRQTPTGQFQKALADGLRFAPSLADADLQGCNLERAFLGVKRPDKRVPNLERADFFEANLSGASLRGARANEAVFFGAELANTVLRDAQLVGANFRGALLRGADFRGATLTGADFVEADIEGARFSGAVGIPDEIAPYLDEAGLSGGRPVESHRPKDSTE
jgi:hypothetical protein